MKLIIRLLILSLVPCVLYSQETYKAHGFTIQKVENGAKATPINTVATDLTISPDSVFFAPGYPSVATVVISNNTNQPINLLQVQSEANPGNKPWGWKLHSISVSTPHYIYPGQSINLTINYWTIIKDDLQTNYLGDSMYVVSSVDTQYVYIFLDPVLISSIPDHPKQFFSVYPNPATEKVTIKFNDYTPTATFEIYDIVGRLRLIQQITLVDGKSEFDISALAEGVYYFKAISGEKVLGVQKLVIATEIRE
jgi:hypothetical protein